MNEWIDQLSNWLTTAGEELARIFTSVNFYNQIAAIIVALLIAMLVTALVKSGARVFRSPPTKGQLFAVRNTLYESRALIMPVISIIALGVAVGVAEALFDESALVRLARWLMAILFFYLLLSRLVQNRIAKQLLAWVGIPLATLHVFGWWVPLREMLDGFDVVLGSIELTLYDLLRTIVIGALMLWIGAIANSTAKNIIRARQNWNPSTRELAAKMFEIGLFFLIFLLLLQVMGINLTTLAVVGGAVAIGLGFGLQQIAANFISGIIILLDRSITPGDFIELEDGRSGTLRELNMRCGILETYDGKDVMVPNETFITSSYTNWTHKDKRQRYALHLQVAYATDLDLLFENIRQICREHPQVLSDPDLPTEYQPDAEIESFGESGIDILVEFWMIGIDDGKNRVGADLMHSIWRMIKANGMEIPFPQREVRILGGQIRLDQ